MKDLGPHLGEIPQRLFDRRIYDCCEFTERYATELAVAIAHRLELALPLREGTGVERLIADRGFVASFRPALSGLLERLAGAGEIERRIAADAGIHFGGGVPLRQPELEALRHSELGLDPALAATLDLLDAAAAAYPAVAAGSTGGEQELFSAGRIALWLAYFSNDNPVYALNNLLTSEVAANRLPPGAGLRLLEVGAGAGSFSRTLLEELERRGRLGDVALYDFTEPSPFFRRRGERELRARFPGLPLRARALDIDLPLAAPGEELQAYHLAVGVNVLHVARDLRGALARLHDALVPGGWLVAGECLRLFPGQSVPADLIFELFRSFTEVETDPELRPHHGFLEPAAWRHAFVVSGFEPVEIVPDVERIRDLYPRFFTGVVAGRRRP